MFSNFGCRISSLFGQCLLKQSTSFIRNTSYLPVKSTLFKNSLILNKSQFRIVYNFPQIKFVVAVVKSKVSVPVLSALVSCYFWVAHQNLAAGAVFLTTGCIHSLMAYGLSVISKNMVGKVYINKEGEISEVLFSSIDIKGNRIDRIHNIDDLINCDYSSKISRTLGFIRIGIDNTNLYYQINVRNCKLIDPEICNYIFGRLWIIKEPVSSTGNRNDTKK